MNVHIVTVSCDKDLKWLKYCIQSIKKYCKNYTGHTVFLDNNLDDCVETEKYLKSINYDYIIDHDAKTVNVGYVRQQYIKFVLDKYLPPSVDYICHVDSDSIFYEEHTPEIYFRTYSKIPDMLIATYDIIKTRRINQGKSIKPINRWRNITEQFIGSTINYEYMRCMPLLYTPLLMNSIRDFVLDRHKCNILDFLKNKNTFTEYNCLGAYAHKFRPTEYTWCNEGEYYKKYGRLPLLQSWSKENIKNKTKLLESLINEPEKNLCLKKKWKSTNTKKVLSYHRDDVVDMYFNL